MGVRDLEDHLDLQACQVKDEQAARALPVGLVTRGHRVGQGTQVPPDQLAHRDTVTRTHVWDTTLEFNRTMGMITEEHSPIVLLSSSCAHLPPCPVNKTRN